MQASADALITEFAEAFDRVMQVKVRGVFLGLIRAVAASAPTPPASARSSI